MELTEDEQVSNLYKRTDLIPWRRAYGALTIIFIVAGTIGSILIMTITFKIKELRTKSGYLLSSYAFVNLVCLLFETVHAVQTLCNITLRRLDCVHYIFLYPFFYNLECIFSMSLVVDIFLAIKKSAWYYNLPKAPYLLCVWTVAIFYGLWLMIAGNLTYPDNNFVPYCDPVTTLHPVVGRIESTFNLSLNILTLLLFFASICTYKRIGKNHKESKGVITRMKGMSTVYLTSAFACNLGAVFFGYFSFEAEMKIYLQSCMGFFATFSFASPFYVSIWRSTEYRKAAARILLPLSCSKRHVEKVKPCVSDWTTISKPNL